MKSLLTAILIFFICMTIYAQDNRLQYFKGPVEFSHIASDGKNLWASSSSGIYRLNISSGRSENFNTLNSGILSNDIYCIALDRSGKIWTGHFEGVSIFDGSTWTGYSRSKNSKYPFNVRAIAFDNDNSAWMASDYGIMKFDGNEWTYYKPVTNDQPTENVMSIAIDQTGNKWIGSNRGFEKFDGKNWILYDTAKAGIKTGGVYSIVIDSKEKKWLRTLLNGLAFYDGQKMTNLRDTSSLNPGRYFSDFAVDKNDNLWVGATNLLKYDGSSWTVYKNSDYRLPGEYINSLAIDSDGNKWVGTNRSVARLGTDSFIPYSLAESWLPGNLIRDIITGADGKVWVITDRGLAVYNGSFWKTLNTENSGLPSNYVSAVTYDSKNNVWFGTANGLVKYDGIRTWTIYNSKNSGLPEDNVQAIAFDSKGVMWLGTAGGIAKYDGDNWKFYNEFNSAFRGSPVSIAIDKTDVKWIGLNAGEIVRYDEKSWMNFSYKDFGYPGSPTPTIYIDENNVKWFNSGGIVKYDDKNWFRYDLRNIGLTIYGKSSFIFYSKDNMLLATENGLYRLNTLNGEIKEDPVNSLLLNKNLTNVNIDRLNNIWMGAWYSGVVVNSGENTFSSSSGKLLLQNYPNPFNSTTTIQYYVPAPGNTTIKVYDILGQEVTTLVDEFKEAGIYSVKFYAGNLPGGIYIYNIQSGGSQDSQKLVYLK